MAECGTYAGYRAHQRASETPCAPCRQAKRDYVRDRRDEKRAGLYADVGPVAAGDATDDPAEVLRDNLRRLESVIPVVQESDPTRLTPLLRERRDTVAALAAMAGDDQHEDEFTRARRERAARSPHLGVNAPPS